MLRRIRIAVSDAWYYNRPVLRRRLLDTEEQLTETRNELVGSQSERSRHRREVERLQRALVAGADNHRCELAWAQQLFGGPFPFAVLREIYGLEDDIKADIQRQVFGTGEPAELRGLDGLLAPGRPPLTAPGYRILPEPPERGPCTHCGDPSCSYDEDC